MINIYLSWFRYIRKYFLMNQLQFTSVSQTCLTLCDNRDCSMPGFPVHYQLLGPSQTHVHRVGDAIPPSHPLPSPSTPSFSLSQHQGLFQWVSSSHQDWSFSIILPVNIQDWFPLGWTAAHPKVGSPCSSRNSKESFSTTQFKSINSSVLSFLYSPALTSIHDYWKNHSFD